MASQILVEPSIPTPNPDNSVDSLQNTDPITIDYDHGMRIEWSHIAETTAKLSSKSNRSEKIALEINAPEEEKMVENKRQHHESYAVKAVESAKETAILAATAVAVPFHWAGRVINASISSMKSELVVYAVGATGIGIIDTFGAVAAASVGAVTGVGLLSEYGYKKYQQSCADDTFIKKTEYNHKVKLFNDKIDAAHELDIKIRQKKDELVKQEEKFNNSEFAVERSFEDAKVMVAIRPTGYGKSLFCNRMMGNQNDIDTISEPENINVTPVYKVAEWGDTNAQTTEIQKEMRQIKMVKKHEDVKSDEGVDDTKIFKLSVVDTQGAFDTNDNDKHFQNQMGEYFRACGGVNMFCIFFKFGDKMTSNYKQLLRNYEIFWGEEFWKHCVIIITKCDIVQDSEKYKKKLQKKLSQLTIPQVRASLNEISGGKCNDIPIFCFGKNNYNISTQTILDTIDNGKNIFVKKYMCKNIVSPMDTLWTQLVAIFAQYKVLIAEIKSLKTEIETLKITNNIQQ